MNLVAARPLLATSTEWMGRSPPQAATWASSCAASSAVRFGTPRRVALQEGGCDWVGRREIWCKVRSTCRRRSGSNLCPLGFSPNRDGSGGGVKTRCFPPQPPPRLPSTHALRQPRDETGGTQPGLRTHTRTPAGRRRTWTGGSGSSRCRRRRRRPASASCRPWTAWGARPPAQRQAGGRQTATRQHGPGPGGCGAGSWCAERELRQSNDAAVEARALQRGAVIQWCTALVSTAFRADSGSRGVKSRCE